MKKITLLALIFCQFFAKAQVQNLVSAPSKEVLTSIKQYSLVFILLTPQEKRIEKLEKKDPETLTAYKASIEIYNSAVKKYGPLLSKYVKDVQYKTTSEISTMDEATLRSCSFIYPFSTASIYSGISIDLYNQKNIESSIGSINAYCDFSVLYKEGTFNHKEMDYFQMFMYSPVTSKKGKVSVQCVTNLNFPFTEDLLADTDLYYVLKTIQHAFDEVNEKGSFGPKPSEEDRLLKEGTLYICRNNLDENYTDTQLQGDYKGKSIVLKKTDFDKKLANAGNTDLFLIVYPFLLMPMGKGNITHAQVIIEGKTMKAIKIYLSNAYAGTTLIGGSVGGNYENVSAKRVEEYNKSFE